MSASNSTDIQDIEAILKGEESLMTREQEVERVIAAFKLNPYEVLDLDMTNPTTVTDADIRKSYRKRSLLIHPDKLSHPRGPEAFDLLKKAESFLLDPEKRKGLDETIRDARMLTLRALSLPETTPNDHERLKKLDPPFFSRVALKIKEIIIEEELRVRRARKMTMIAEGTEAKRQEDAITKRKRELEDKKRWEASHFTSSFAKQRHSDLSVTDDCMISLITEVLWFLFASHRNPRGSRNGLA